VDSGLPPWAAVLLLVPYVNYAFVATLALLPSHAGEDRRSTVPTGGPGNVVAALMAAAAGSVIALVAGVAGTRMHPASYGWWLFIVTPFAMGVFTSYVYNRGATTSRPETVSHLVATLLLSGALMIAMGIEGVICLVLALPLVLPLTMAGGAVGKRAALMAVRRPASSMFMLLALPLTGTTEPSTGHTLHEVQTSVVIDARPDDVWPHVVAFSELPPPTEWIFRAGVAYPIRARIDGQGVGAVRYCVFSTGSFVEPITRWEPGRRLSFDVAEAPASMRELSPYRDLSPPHLHGYLRPKRGEFRFVDLGDGRTRLEGSTWYEIEMAPEMYWQVFSDALIHRIHRRVLDHIKHEAEVARPARVS
jgi:hypothetical protein